MINGLDLFSGIGGISLALKEWVKPIAYCEIDPYCQTVLLSRISDGSLYNAPIWDDIKTLSYDGRSWPGIDIIYAGFPCQDISIAGTKKGLDGKRSKLIYEVLRLVGEIKPSFLFLENVANIIQIGGSEIINKLDSLGMQCRWACISAKSCGAPHKRDRWFLLAHSNSKSSRETYKETKLEPLNWETRLRHTRQVGGNFSQSYWKENKPPVYGMDDGIFFELDRGRALGNAVIPQQAREAFKILMCIKDENGMD